MEVSFAQDRRAVFPTHHIPVPLSNPGLPLAVIPWLLHQHRSRVQLQCPWQQAAAPPPLRTLLPHLLLLLHRASSFSVVSPSLPPLRAALVCAPA